MINEIMQRSGLIIIAYTSKGSVLLGGQTIVIGCFWSLLYVFKSEMFSF